MTNTFEEFNNHMNWTMFYGTEEQHKKIYDAVEKVESFEALEEQLGYSVLEEEMSAMIFTDVNLHSTIEYFEEYSIQQIADMIYARYGSCIDLYHSTEEDMYVLVFETR